MMGRKVWIAFGHEFTAAVRACTHRPLGQLAWINSAHSCMIKQVKQSELDTLVGWVGRVSSVSALSLVLMHMNVGARCCSMNVPSWPLIHK